MKWTYLVFLWTQITLLSYLWKGLIFSLIAMPCYSLLQFGSLCYLDSGRFNIQLNVPFFYVIYRFDAQTGADREVQRILLELLNQMDGFDQTVNVKVRQSYSRIISDLILTIFNDQSTYYYHPCLSLLKLWWHWHIPLWLIKVHINDVARDRMYPSMLELFPSVIFLLQLWVISKVDMWEQLRIR